MSTIVDNILLFGYIREHEQHIGIEIAKVLVNVINTYCRTYSIQKIGLLQEFHTTQIHTLKHRCLEFDLSQMMKASQHKNSHKSMQEMINNAIRPHCFKNINGNEEMIDIECGSEHALFLTSTGNVYAFGSNDSGQCGLGQHITYAKTPRLILFELQNKIKSIACGALHSLFINEKNGELLVCGYNYCNQLGIASFECQKPLFSSSCDNVISNECSISYDHSHSTSYQSDDASDCKSYFVEISDESDTDDNFNDTKNKCIYEPILNQYFVNLDIRFIQIKCGSDHSLCISTNGECHTFGHNGFGNLGNGICSQYGKGCDIPYRLDINKTFVDGSCGKNHNILITNNNEIVVFGNNSAHQCSNIDKEIIESPLVLSKKKEFGISENCYVEKIICINDKSVFIIDVYKRNVFK